MNQYIEERSSKGSESNGDDAQIQYNTLARVYRVVEETFRSSDHT